MLGFNKPCYQVYYFGYITNFTIKALLFSFNTLVFKDLLKIN